MQGFDGEDGFNVRVFYKEQIVCASVLAIERKIRRTGVILL